MFRWWRTKAAAANSVTGLSPRPKISYRKLPRYGSDKYALVHSDVLHTGLSLERSLNMLFHGKRVRSARRRNAMVLIYGIVIMVAMFALISLAVDMGRVQVAKTELQRAADAGARYAALGINDGTAITKGIAAAGDNTADGSAVIL